MKGKAGLLFTALLVFVDALMLALAFVLAYKLRLWIDSPPAIKPFSSYLGMMGLHVFSILTVFFFNRLYHLRRAISRLDEVGKVFASVSIGTLISVAFTSFLYKNELDYPRLMVIYAWLLGILLVSVGRVLNGYVRTWLRHRGIGATRLLIIGTGEVGQMILQKVRHRPGLGYQVVGFIGNSSGPREIMGVPVLGKREDIPAVIESYEVDEAIVALPGASHEEILAIVALCEEGRASIKVFPDVFQIMASQVSIDDLDGLPLLTIRDIALRGWKLALKRAMDLAGAAVGLVFLSPLMLLIALLIKLDSPGPVFYVQERMGLDARPFWCLKFRSMRQNAEEETGPVWASRDDPRRTKIGAFIRRYSLDELPQLINVLLGEMSLVGPRPERPVFVEQFKKSIPRYMDRHREKAGMTGWAQIHGLRGDTSIIERTKYDLWYIENWSLLLDIKIILRTIVQVLSGKNAY